jgi:hypothetical protein|tara:strand:+ start:777 stop:1370 length:594 start_codon:yes stop_codon:yes gene_type:complete
MTTLNVEARQPDKMDYASPVQFRFKLFRIPNVEFFVQSVNIPGITLGEATQTTPLKDIPIPGDKLNYASLELSFLVDENLNNYKELHDWLIGIGFPKDHTQFRDALAAGADRFPGSTAPTRTQRQTVATAEGAIYSDATLTILNSKNIAKTEIRFRDVYPTSLGALNYNVAASDVDYLTVAASFNYSLYEIHQISTI